MFIEYGKQFKNKCPNCENACKIEKKILSLPRLMIFHIKRILENGDIDQTKTELFSIIDLKTLMINGLEGTSEYEIIGFIHIWGDRIETCSY